jgi:hypothetical protein
MEAFIGPRACVRAMDLEHRVLLAIGPCYRIIPLTNGCDAQNILLGLPAEVRAISVARDAWFVYADVVSRACLRRVFYSASRLRFSYGLCFAATNP